MPAQTRRRSSRRSGAIASAACEEPTTASPSDDAEEDPAQEATDRRVTRGRGRVKAERKRGATRLPDLNTGKNADGTWKCPIFLLSHELLTLIWTFLDSRTKMTTTVRSWHPNLLFRLTELRAPQSVSRRWQLLCTQSQVLKLKFASRTEETIDGALRAVIARFHNLRHLDMMSCHLASSRVLEVRI